MGGSRNSSAQEVLASLQSMHKACWARGTPTVALSVPESTVTGTTQYPEAAKKWHAVNKLLATWAKAEQGERSLVSPFFVNSARLLAFDHASRARGLWDPDSLHFTAAGSREFGNKLAPIIASHLQEQRPKANAARRQAESPKRRSRSPIAGA